MAINGKTITLYVEVGADNWQLLASQRDMGVSQTRDEIDASSKDDDEQVTLPGRSTREITVDGLYVASDVQYQFLVGVFNSGINTNIRLVDDSDASYRQANVSVLELSENHPDQDVSTINLRMKVSGGFIVG